MNKPKDTPKSQTKPSNKSSLSSSDELDDEALKNVSGGKASNPSGHNLLPTFVPGKNKAGR